MRKWITLAVALSLLPALAGIAGAVLRQSADISFTTRFAGHATGIRVDVHARDPAAPGSKPKRATKLVIAFPLGTRFNLGIPLVRPCTLTDTQITKPFGPSCPRRSLIGTGSAIVNAMPMAPKPAVPATVKVYVAGARSMLVVVSNDQMLLPGTPPIVIHALVSGPQLTLSLPHVVYGASKRYKFAGITAVIARLKFEVPALGSLITSGRCSARRFVVSARFSYADHTSLVRNSRSSCR
jgi:hypothetical protein